RTRPLAGRAASRGVERVANARRVTRKAAAMGERLRRGCWGRRLGCADRRHAGRPRDPRRRRGASRNLGRGVSGGRGLVRGRGGVVGGSASVLLPSAAVRRLGGLRLGRAVARGILVPATPAPAPAAPTTSLREV